MKTIYLGADHAGFKLKEKIKRYLQKQKIPHQDLGNLKYQKTDDFTDYAAKVARKVAKTKQKGILICGSSQGMCIAANKIKGILAAPVWNLATAKHAKAHDNANILCLGAEFVKPLQAQKMIASWLKTKFKTDKKYSRRLQKIKKLER